jgi:hypothetical protein
MYGLQIHRAKIRIAPGHLKREVPKNFLQMKYGATAS